jgi:hypothetical protein
MKHSERKWWVTNIVNKELSDPCVMKDVQCFQTYGWKGKKKFRTESDVPIL